MKSFLPKIEKSLEAKPYINDGFAFVFSDDIQVWQRSVNYKRNEKKKIRKLNKSKL